MSAQSVFTLRGMRTCMQNECATMDTPNTLNLTKQIFCNTVCMLAIKLQNFLVKKKKTHITFYKCKTAVHDQGLKLVRHTISVLCWSVPNGRMRFGPRPLFCKWLSRGGIPEIHIAVVECKDDLRNSDML